MGKVHVTSQCAHHIPRKMLWIMKSVTYAKCRRWVCQTAPVNMHCVRFEGRLVYICITVYIFMSVCKLSHPIDVFQKVSFLITEWEGSLSFNMVPLGQRVICEYTKLTAETQSSNVHPPTTPSSLISPPTPCLSWWGRHTNADMIQLACWQHIFIMELMTNTAERINFEALQIFLYSFNFFTIQK